MNTVDQLKMTPIFLENQEQKEEFFLEKQLQTLKAAAQLLGELGTSAPTELFAFLEQQG